MRRAPFFLFALVGVFACTDSPTQSNLSIDLVVSYGVEPSPFFPSATNQLEEVAQHLGVVQGQIGSLCHPPDPCRPDPAIIGQLGAMTNELAALDSRVKAVLSMPPDPIVPGYGELMGAALAAHGAANNVLVAAREAKLGFEPAPFSPVDVAFGLVEGGAFAIQESVMASEFCQPPVGTSNLCLPDVLPGY